MKIYNENLEDGTLRMDIRARRGTGGITHYDIHGFNWEGNILFQMDYQEHHDEKDGTTPEDVALKNLEFYLKGSNYGVSRSEGIAKIVGKKQ